jgi:protein O-mannosyl-transferase
MSQGKQISKFSISGWVAMVIFTVLSFILYGNTLRNQYCMDDSIVITHNTFTKQGLKGIHDIFTTESFTGFFGKQKELVSGARYRPLSIATFAIEQEFFHGNPMISHFINILLYALTAFFLYLILQLMLKGFSPVYEYVPLITALLFLFHPIHTEVIANIKGRDEILALLLSFSSCFAMIRYQEKQNRILLISSALLWFLALLAKENAIVFWALMPMMLWMLGAKKFNQYKFPILAFTISAVVFLLIRQSVIGGASGVSNELMNDSFLQATSQQKYATIFYTLSKYIILLIYPSPLTFDYYPYHISLVEWSNAGAVAGLLIYIGLFVWALVIIKKKFFISLSIAFYLLPLLLVSNLFFPIGTFMSERFMYFSSIGFCLLAGLGISYLISLGNNWKYGMFAILGLIFLLFSMKTISRNRAWYDDYTLFTTDVKTSVNGAKSNCSAGGILLDSSDTITEPVRLSSTLNRSIYYLKKAVAIHPKYFDAWLLLGNAYFKKENCTDSSLGCYTRILSLDVEHKLAYNNAQALVNREKDVDIKLKILTQMDQYKPNDYEVNYQMGTLYGKKKNDLERAILYLTKASVINPIGKDAFIDLGVAYGMKRDYIKSAESLQKAMAIDPYDVGIYMNLAVTYYNLGDKDKASEYSQKANELKHHKLLK